MSIVRRLFSMFSSSGGRRTRTRGRTGGGGLMSLVSRFVGGGRQRSTTRF